MFFFIEAFCINCEGGFDIWDCIFVLFKGGLCQGYVSMSYKEVGVCFYSGVQFFEKDGYVGVFSCF